MSECGAVAKRKKKSKTQKPKVIHGKLKQRQQQPKQPKQQKQKIQLTQEFEENEKEVMTLLENLENTSLLSESTNNSQRDVDNKSPSERFFNNNEQQRHQFGIDGNNEGDEVKSAESINGYYDGKLSKVSTDELSSSAKSTQPTLASSFIQIEPDNIQLLIRVDRSHYLLQQRELLYWPKTVLEKSLNSLSFNKKLAKNTVLMINRYTVEYKSRKQKMDKNLLNTLQNVKKVSRFYKDDNLYKTFCEFKFKPIFLEPSLNSMIIPSKKFLSLNIKELRFIEHPLLQEEHRLANNLELLYEHRAQRLQERIIEKLYADLQIERIILNDLLRTIENGCRAESSTNQENTASKIEHHLYKVKALREKLFDEELTNKQLLKEILNNWLKLKNLRGQQEQPLTSLKLRIKIEDLSAVESRRRLKLWTQRFETDLNEIYREQLEEFYRCKRLRQQYKLGDAYIGKPRKPLIKHLSLELKEKYAKCFLNPQEPRIDVVRIFANNEDKDLVGTRKTQSYFMRIFFDRQMVGESRVYRLERDLSVIVNENIGIMLNRSLPKDIRIKLYKKSKISSIQKVATIIVPLPLSSPIAREANPIIVTFSSQKQPLSGYLRLHLQTDEEFYPSDMVDKLFPAPRQHTKIPKKLVREWHERKLLNTSVTIGTSLYNQANAQSDTDEPEENVETATDICTFQEDLLRFCDPLELENNQRLKLLRSRYLRNDARTRDLRFIPMLDNEVEFEWEKEETILETGNWMNPIDLHKHDGKKYLRSLYTAMQNQCARLNKVVESRENLLLNDEPISWSAFFQIIKLIFQPRLIVNMDRNLSLASNPTPLTFDDKQNFKIVCNIVRATGIPVRITSPEHTDTRDGSTPESSNIFILQNFKYSNVRPFIAVSYKDKFSRTMTAEGSNPTWNEQLILQISGCLADLHDDLKISLFDEVIENQMNDDTALKNADIYQRIQSNWLGEYRVPINAILMQQKMDAVFELNTPKIIIGYKRSSLENVKSNAETNIMVEQFPEIKEAVRLWCYISLEPTFELPSISSKCLECSELMEVRQHLSTWCIEAAEMHPSRFLEPFVCTAEGKRLCITRILQPLAPPIEASENLLESACRFVSLIDKPKFYEPCIRFTGVWLNNQLILDTTWASPKDLGVLLCNYLLHMGLRCFLALGIAYPYGECTFAMYTNEEGDMFFIDPYTGKRYALKDVFCPLQTIKMVVAQNNFYLNIQTESRVSMMNYNWNDSSCWLNGFTKKNPAPLAGFQSTEYKYCTSFNTSELKYNIERKIMKKINSWRTLRQTIWNRAFQPYLLSILENMEQSVTFGSGSSYEELKYNNMMADEFPNYKNLLPQQFLENRLQRYLENSSILLAHYRLVSGMST